MCSSKAKLLTLWLAIGVFWIAVSLVNSELDENSVRMVQEIKAEFLNPLLEKCKGVEKNSSAGHVYIMNILCRSVREMFFEADKLRLMAKYKNAKEKGEIVVPEMGYTLSGGPDPYYTWEVEQLREWMNKASMTFLTAFIEKNLKQFSSFMYGKMDNQRAKNIEENVVKMTGKYELIANIQEITEQLLIKGRHFSSVEKVEKGYECLFTGKLLYEKVDREIIKRKNDEYWENSENTTSENCNELAFIGMQFVANLAVFSLEIPELRPTTEQWKKWKQSMDWCTVPQLIHQILDKFSEQILMKLRAKCHEIGQMKYPTELFEQNMCNSVFEISAEIDQLKKATKEPSADGGFKIMEETVSKIKHHIFLHDTKELWSHLGKKLPKESEKKIREKVDKLSNESNIDELKDRFETKIKQFRALQAKGDFSSPKSKLLAFDCVYTGHWMVFAREWDGIKSHLLNPLDELAATLRQFAVDLLVYRMEIKEIRCIPDILLWTHGNGMY